MPTAIRTLFREFYFYWFIIKIVADGYLSINPMFPALAMFYRIIQVFMLSAAMMNFVFILRMMDMVE